MKNKIISNAGASNRILQGYSQNRFDKIDARKKILRREGVVEIEDDGIKVIPADNKVVKVEDPKPAIKVEAPELIKLEFKEPIRIEREAIFLPFGKVDKEKQLVTGIASSEAVDSYGDIVEFNAIKEALPAYLEFGNIREMHNASAVGVIKASDLKESEKQWWITSKIVDDSAWSKVVEGVYKGYSIGGNIIDAEPLTIEVPKSMIDEAGKVDKKEFNDFVAYGMEKSSDEETVTVYTGGWRITKIELVEVSLVDRPANPDALISSFKSAVNTFTPDSAIVFGQMGKIEVTEKKSLTPKSIGSIFDAEVVKTTKTTNDEFIKNLAIKLNKNMKNKETTIKTIVASVLKHFEDKGLDLSKASDNEAVEVSTADLVKVINFSCQTAVEALNKGDGDGKDDEEDDAKEEDDKKEEDDAKEDEKAEKAAKASDKQMGKALTSFGKVLSGIVSDVEAIKKAGVAKSTQDADEALDKKKDGSIFKGMFDL